MARDPSSRSVGTARLLSKRIERLEQALALEKQRHSAKKNRSSGSHHSDVLGLDAAGTAGAGLAAIGKDESDGSFLDYSYDSKPSKKQMKKERSTRHI